MYLLSLRVYAIVLGMLLSFEAAAVKQDDEFKQGINAFKAQQYDRAIGAFEASRRNGNQTSALFYNLGVSYYKTAQYKKAEHAFSQLLSDTQFQQLAQYNLGLVTLEQDQTQTALDWFRKARTNKQGDPKITILAGRMIEKLTPSKDFYNGVISVSYAYDDNVNLVSTESPSNQSDNYYEVFGYISVPLESVEFNAYLLQHDYQTVNSADYFTTSAGVGFPIMTDNWILTPKLQLSRSDLNSNDYQSITDYSFEARTVLADKSRLLFRIRYSDINSNNPAYDYLQGDRQQFRIQHTQKTGLGQLRLRYELELNNRQNLPSTNYSPERHTLRARIKKSLADDWRVKAELSWRNSQYDEAADIRRTDTRYMLRLNVDKELNKNWLTGLSYYYTDNHSNITSEAYTRHEVRAQIDWQF